MREDILIVDGYNVIFAWPELKKISKSSLEHARSRIKHMLQNYGKHKGYRVILVFDGKYAHPAVPKSLLPMIFWKCIRLMGKQRTLILNGPFSLLKTPMPMYMYAPLIMRNRAKYSVLVLCVSPRVS